jgi:hypothetical protein
MGIWDIGIEEWEKWVFIPLSIIPLSIIPLSIIPLSAIFRLIAG